MDVLKALMNDIRKYYRGNVEGIQFDTVLEQRAIDFQKIGFSISGELDDMPIGNTNYFLIDKDLEDCQIKEEYQLSSSSEPNGAYDSVLKSEIKNFKKSLDFSTEKIDVQFVALDKDKFVGGIYGHFQYEYLFINVLFVNKKYRGRKIASKLMDKIESEAVRQGVTNIYLTTFEFQALGFYKKRGYRVVMKIEDFPIGSEEYTLYKDMKLVK
jgi:GNAT superfamily N-acetyltransferase